jgi:outer membrane protein TolC
MRGDTFPEGVMTRSTLFDRLNQELEAFGRKAQAALDEGKLQIEQLRVRRKRDNTARDLGLLIHRRERGGEVDPRRVEALLLRLDDLEAELARLERQTSDARRQNAATAGAPPQNSAAAGTPSPPPATEPPQPTAGASA